MACLPANIIGILFILLLIFDMSEQRWADLPYHAVVGISITAIYYVICLVLGEFISGAILFVPIVLLGMFILSSWLLQQHIKNNNCCMTCKGASNTPSSLPQTDIYSIFSEVFGVTPSSVTPSSITKKCQPPSVRV